MLALLAFSACLPENSSPKHSCLMGTFSLLHPLSFVENATFAISPNLSSQLQASSQIEPDLDENVRHLRIEDKAHAQASQSLELEDYEEGPSCPSATHLIIQGNEEFGLDVEWKSRVFPNITSFEAEIFFDTDLRLIWTHLQHVKTLILHLKTSVPEQGLLACMNAKDSMIQRILLSAI